MAKHIKQFRYYAKGDDEKNSPAIITLAGLTSGKIFRDYTPIISLGIQSLPGTKFYLNDSANPVIIGHSGLYELNLGDKMRIVSLAFDQTSIEAIENNPGGYLIIDIIYEGA